MSKIVDFIISKLFDFDTKPKEEIPIIYGNKKAATDYSRYMPKTLNEIRKEEMIVEFKHEEKTEKLQLEIDSVYQVIIDTLKANGMSNSLICNMLINIKDVILKDNTITIITFNRSLLEGKRNVNLTKIYENLHLRISQDLVLKIEENENRILNYFETNFK